MRRIGIGVLLGALGLVGCRGAASTSTLPSTKVGLRVTDPQVARQYGARTEHIDLPFQLAKQGVNGTGLMIAYLQKLETGGAVYVSDLSYALQLRHNGKDIECVSKIAISDGSVVERAAAVADEPIGAEDEPEYTTTVKPWRPKLADQWVIDRELSCQQHAQQVIRPEGQERWHRDTTYNAEVGPSTPVGLRRPDNTEIVFYDRCTYEPERRYVHRYEHFIAARFAPPDLAVIQRSYADHPLIAEPPLCHEIQRAAGQPYRQHISGNAYYPSKVERERENVYRPQKPVPSSGGE